MVSCITFQGTSFIKVSIKMTSAGIFLSHDFSVSTGPPFDMLSTCFSHVVSRIISNKWNIEKTLNWLSYIENKGNYVIKSPFFFTRFQYFRTSCYFNNLQHFISISTICWIIEIMNVWSYFVQWIQKVSPGFL